MPYPSIILSCISIKLPRTGGSTRHIPGKIRRLPTKLRHLPRKQRRVYGNRRQSRGRKFGLDGNRWQVRGKNFWPSWKPAAGSRTIFQFVVRIPRFVSKFLIGTFKRMDSGLVSWQSDVLKAWDGTTESEKVIRRRLRAGTAAMIQYSSIPIS